jgi:hypothetical protein
MFDQERIAQLYRGKESVVPTGGVIPSIRLTRSRGAKMVRGSTGATDVNAVEKGLSEREEGV